MGGAARYASHERSRARTGGGMVGALEQLEQVAQDLSSVWPDIGQVWADRQQAIFDTGSLGRWAPLKSATILRKRRAGIVMDTMVETGTLRRAMTNAVPRSEGPRFAVFGPPVGAPIDYARFHARGMGGPQRNPAPRLAPAERAAMVDRLRAHMGIG